jgi:[ribosomal protein S5]-alanine N-acetyltransferase
MQAIETERLVIRNFVVDDWPALHKMIVQYQQSPYAQYDHQWPTDPDEFPKIVQWFADGDDYLAVYRKSEGNFIGFVCLNPDEYNNESARNIGYIFDADYHGNGYATEACQAMIARAFNDLDAAYVVTGTAEANTPSVHLLGRLGLKPIGNSMFAITKDEWQMQKQDVS